MGRARKGMREDRDGRGWDWRGWDWRKRGRREDKAEREDVGERKRMGNREVEKREGGRSGRGRNLG